MKVLTKERARAITITHLQKYESDGSVVVSQHMVSYWWRTLNIAIFNGWLQKPRSVEIAQRKGYWGMCIPCWQYPSDTTIDLLLNSTYPCKRTFLEVLIHEMVHAWEYQQQSAMTHGTSFFEWKQWVKQHVDLNLSIRIGIKHGQN